MGGGEVWAHRYGRRRAVTAPSPNRFRNDTTGTRDAKLHSPGGPGIPVRGTTVFPVLVSRLVCPKCARSRANPKYPHVVLREKKPWEGSLRATGSTISRNIPNIFPFEYSKLRPTDPIAWKPFDFNNFTEFPYYRNGRRNQRFSIV